MSSAEKVAWCEANGVEAPAFVRAAAQSEAGSVKAKCRCCAHRGGCDEAETADSGPLKWVHGLAAARCRGSGPSALMASAPGLPPAAPRGALTQPPLVDSLTLVNLEPAASALTPPDPPPRSR